MQGHPERLYTVLLPTSNLPACAELIIIPAAVRSIALANPRGCGLRMVSAAQTVGWGAALTPASMESYKMRSDDETTFVSDGWCLLGRHTPKARRGLSRLRLYTNFPVAVADLTRLENKQEVFDRISLHALLYRMLQPKYIYLN